MPDDTKPLGQGISAAEVTTLVNMFNGMLLAMEGRLGDKIDEHAKQNAERWARHDIDMRAQVDAWNTRFLKLESSFTDHVVVANAHYAKEHDEELIMNARMKPIRWTMTYIASRWKTIALIIVSLLAILGFTSDTVEKLVTHL